MPRFFFDLHNTAQGVDDYGVELPDEDAARVEARQAAAKMISDCILEYRLIDPAHIITVRDAGDAVVYTITFAALIKSPPETAE